MTDNVSGITSAREDLCRLLSACYYELDPAFSEERVFDSMLAAAAVIDPDLAECARRLGQEFVAQDLETLLVDYARLFIIAPDQVRAMPYASFWLTDDQSMRHEATTTVLEMYEQGGFDVSDELHELPDHIAVELEFLYLLIFGQNQAQVSGAAEELAAANALHRRFAAEHMNAWIGAFATAVKAGAKTPFYRELAELTEKFVRMEADLPRLS
jgi:TorA maturation chaperone TorD